MPQADIEMPAWQVYSGEFRSPTHGQTARREKKRIRALAADAGGSYFSEAGGVVSQQESVGRPSDV